MLRRRYGASNLRAFSSQGLVLYLWGMAKLLAAAKTSQVGELPCVWGAVRRAAACWQVPDVHMWGLYIAHVPYRHAFYRIPRRKHALSTDLGARIDVRQRLKT